MFWPDQNKTFFCKKSLFLLSIKEEPVAVIILQKMKREFS